MNPESEKRRASNDRFRGIFHMAMGALYIVVGAGVIYMEQTKRLQLGAAASYVLGCAMIAYGAFRIFRGLKRKNGQAQGW